MYRIVKDPANCGCGHNVCAPKGGANPNEVLLPSINSPVQSDAQQWLKQWLALAGRPYAYADIATFHGYGYTENPEAIYFGVASMRATLAKSGLENAELWNTEASWSPLRGPVTQSWEASWLIRYHIMQALRAYRVSSGMPTTTVRGAHSWGRHAGRRRIIGLASGLQATLIPS